MFEIISQIKITYSDLKNWIGKRTFHITERERRFQKVDLKHIHIFKVFVINTEHKNGYEIHVLTCNAEILIFNYRTHKFITVLLARPAQLMRYAWIPNHILEKAKQNCENGYNYL